jgi:signal transduction histidine kinase
MDKSIAIERITEIENLTDSLEDDIAQWLINWGIDHIDRVLTGANDDEDAGNRLNRLIAIIRTINHIVPDRLVKRDLELAIDIQTLVERYHDAFGKETAIDTLAVAKQIQSLSEDAAVRYLIEQFASTTTSGV